MTNIGSSEWELLMVKGKLRPSILEGFKKMYVSLFVDDWEESIAALSSLLSFMPWSFWQYSILICAKHHYTERVISAWCYAKPSGQLIKVKGKK